MGTDEFIQKIGPAARRVCLAYNLPASVCIAQAAIESAWGRYVIGEYNFFGRKWNGIGPCKSLPTEEVDSNGNWYTITANFQLYDSLDAAIEDWCQLMRNDSNYEAAVEIWDKTWNLTEFVNAMAKKYATDPDYARKVLSTIAANNLTVYDHEEA